jgi:hypothetical protein
VIKEYFTFIDNDKITFLNELLINDFINFNKILIKNSSSNINELIDGNIYFKWHKTKYIPNYDHDFINKKFGFIKSENIGNNLLFYD